jgi:hypothetical protein
MPIVKILNNKYIDKTGIIIKVIEFLKTHDFIVFAYQNGYGKSLNMKILMWFFKKRFKQNRLFINTNDKCGMLSISKNKSFFDSNFGCYLVIFFNFECISGNTYEQVLQSFCDTMARMFKHTISENDLTNSEVLISSFVTICKKLCAKHGKVLIMIDTYDAPFLNLMKSLSMSNEEYLNLQRLFVDFFTNLKQLDSVKFIFSGTTKIKSIVEILDSGFE